jgi:hypothetical protein
MEERLPQLEKKLYIFEAKNLTDPSRMVVQFVSRCIKCIKQGKSGIIGNKSDGLSTLSILELGK